ncbi:hypothetical protein [Nostoc favosum]|uniref:Uncharacterized protein n=1 Tax=Nostoc favosum CHAB5714 TaxID=2780399 RepID=A0ABS8I2X7_9NOSO|nr:hypothetical protein [Nostoc favosum]MCC5598063.1 hypothetical protein [Nostoc favosum CHAB5714]
MKKIPPKVQLSMPHAPCPMPNAQFKFCQPKRDRLKASTIISLLPLCSYDSWQDKFR